MAEDYYTTLGIHRNASAEQIHKAYRELARRYHPDLNPDDPQAEKKFEQIQAAFDVLSDPEQRAAYNRTIRSFASVRSSPKNVRDGADPTEDAGRAFAETRKHARTRPPLFGWCGSEYEYAMIVATVMFLVIVVTLGLCLALGPPDEQDSQRDPEDEAILGLIVGLVCCVGTPLYLIVMVVLAGEHFNR